MSEILQFPPTKRKTGVPSQAAKADLLADCCRELSGFLVDDVARYRRVRRVLDRLRTEELYDIGMSLKTFVKAVEAENG